MTNVCRTIDRWIKWKSRGRAIKESAPSEFTSSHLVMSELWGCEKWEW